MTFWQFHSYLHRFVLRPAIVLVTVSVDHVAFYSLLQRLDAQSNEREPADET